jgi:hypothetical protein
MSNNDTFNLEQLTDDGGGFEFLAQAVKQTNSPNAYEDKTEFKAIIISPGQMVLKTKQIPGVFGTGPGELVTTAHGTAAPGYYGYRVRITEENSPHAFLPMPCGKNSKKPEVNNLLMEIHTLGYTTMNSLSEGDEVTISLRKRDGVYDLAYGRILEKIGTNKLKLMEMRTQTGNDTCVSPSNSFGENSINILAGAQMQKANPIEFIIGGPSTAADIVNVYGISPQFAQAIVDTANAVGVPDPGWIANVINIESAGTFKSSTVNSGSGATGLIQFYPGETRESGGISSLMDNDTLGIFVDQNGEPLSSYKKAHRREAARILGGLSELDQMVIVKQYFNKYRGRMKTQLDVITAVFMPAYLGTNPYQTFSNAAGVEAYNPGIRSIADYYNKFYPSYYKLPTSLN